METTTQSNSTPSSAINSSNTENGNNNNVNPKSENNVNNVVPTRGAGVRILCMDGGGMKGVTLCKLLQIFEDKIKMEAQESGEEPKPLHEYFDLICGTSTGALMAIWIGQLGKTATEAKEMYESMGNQVFRYEIKNGKTAWRAFRGRGWYNSDKFETFLKEKFQDPQQQNQQLDFSVDLKKLPKVFTIATNASKTLPEPYLFRNYIPEEINKGDGQTYRTITYKGTQRDAAKIWQAARATSAAPTFFDSFNGWEQMSLLDGGLVANNPSFAAIFEAHRIWPTKKIQLLVSLGCGDEETAVAAATNNVVTWGKSFVSSLVNSATQTKRIDDDCRRVFDLVALQNDPEHYYYFRLSPPLVPGAALDSIDPTILKKLCDKAEEYANSEYAAIRIGNAVKVLLNKPITKPKTKSPSSDVKIDIQ